MKTATSQLILVLFLSASLSQGQSQTRDALGKIDFQTLFDAAPALPATTVDAAKRAFSGQITEQRPPDLLDSFYDTYRAKTDAARAVLQEALANSSQSMAAIQQRSVAQANASGLISQMGGVERMGQMSEAELRNMSGAPPGAGGGGMQAMMQKMMSDPAYDGNRPEVRASAGRSG